MRRVEWILFAVAIVEKLGEIETCLEDALSLEGAKFDDDTVSDDRRREDCVPETSLVITEEILDLTLVVKNNLEVSDEGRKDEGVTTLWNELATLTTLEEVTEGVPLAVTLDVTISTSLGEDA